MRGVLPAIGGGGTGLDPGTVEGGVVAVVGLLGALIAPDPPATSGAELWNGLIKPKPSSTTIAASANTMINHVLRCLADRIPATSPSDTAATYLPGEDDLALTQRNFVVLMVDPLCRVRRTIFGRRPRCV